MAFIAVVEQSSLLEPYRVASPLCNRCKNVFKPRGNCWEIYIYLRKSNHAEIAACTGAVIERYSVLRGLRGRIEKHGV